MAADTISLARGAPSLDIIDIAGLKAAAAAALSADPGGLTSYGSAYGYGPLREWVARKHGVEAANVMLTNGSMQADAFVFDLLLEAGDTVIVELPTYDRTLLSLRGRRADVRAVELEADGLDVAALERVLLAGARPKLAHIIPNFQNPAGCTLSLEKRERLLALARQYDFLVFEDDPYRDLRFRGSTLPTMVSLDPQHVLYASTFSKTVAPGVRIGYLVGPEDLIAQLAAQALGAYISPNMLAQGIVNQFARSGALERSVATVKTALHARADALASALARELPDARFVKPDGGYFLWLELPRGTDVAALLDASAARGVRFVKGSAFALEGCEASLRLAYSAATPEQIGQGVSRLADAYREITAGVAA